MQTTLGGEQTMFRGKQWGRRYLLAALILTAAAGGLEAAENRGMPYQLFWHAYRLGQLSSEPEGRLRIVSQDNVDPTTFKFSPRGSDGRELLVCDKDGFCEVRWSDNFYRSGREIAHNQPAGSLTISFSWKASRDVGGSLLVELFFKGRGYGESLYHWVALRGEFARMENR